MPQRSPFAASRPLPQPPAVPNVSLILAPLTLMRPSPSLRLTRARCHTLAVDFSAHGHAAQHPVFRFSSSRLPRSRPTSRSRGPTSILGLSSGREQFREPILRSTIWSHGSQAANSSPAPGTRHLLYRSLCSSSSNPGGELILALAADPSQPSRTLSPCPLHQPRHRHRQSQLRTRQGARQGLPENSLTSPHLCHLSVCAQVSAGVGTIREDGTVNQGKAPITAGCISRTLPLQSRSLLCALHVSVTLQAILRAGLRTRPFSQSQPLRGICGHRSIMLPRTMPLPAMSQPENDQPPTRAPAAGTTGHYRHRRNRVRQQTAGIDRK